MGGVKLQSHRWTRMKEYETRWKREGRKIPRELFPGYYPSALLITITHPVIGKGAIRNNEAERAQLCSWGSKKLGALANRSITPITTISLLLFHWKPP